ncbi:MAG: STAS domain-containing protein [Candidatus Aquicultorales bacterium]
MKLTIVEDPVPAVIANGELDEANASDFRNAVYRAFPPGHRRIALDLTRLDYLDSGGLRAILGVHKLVRSRGGMLGIAMEKGALRDLVGACGLAFQPEVLFFNSLDECVDRLPGA